MRQESVWIITGQVAWQSYPGRRPVCFIESIRREILAGQSEPVIGDSHQQHGRQVRERGETRQEMAIFAAGRWQNTVWTISSRRNVLNTHES